MFPDGIPNWLKKLYLFTAWFNGIYWHLKTIGHSGTGCTQKYINVFPFESLQCTLHNDIQTETHKHTHEIQLFRKYSQCHQKLNLSHVFSFSFLLLQSDSASNGVPPSVSKRYDVQVNCKYEFLLLCYLKLYHIKINTRRDRDVCDLAVYSEMK